jgi:hypothetical protein
MSEDMSLISLAVWLHREAEAARRLAADAPEPYGERLLLDNAARLERACEIVKEAADKQRQQRAAVKNLSKSLPRRA